MRREYIVGTGILSVLVVVAFLVWFLGIRRGNERLVIASGVKGGTYARIATGLAEACANHPDLKLSLEVRSTTGSGRNLDLVSSRQVDVAIVQSSFPESRSVRVIAPLYREFLHVLVHRDSPITSPWQLAGKRVALGERGSGTRLIAELLLDHYGVAPSSFVDLDDDPQSAAGKLLAGDIDLLVLVAALHTPVIEELVASGEVRFLSFGSNGEADGLTTRYPYLGAARIPAHTYPCPKAAFPALPAEPVHTLSLTSLLIGHRDLEKDVVHRLTTALFQNRGALAKSIPEAYQIAEPQQPATLPYPIHLGAQRYYRRGEPGFLLVWAEVIALFVSLFLTGGAALGALYRRSLQRKKDRIDHYYIQVARTLQRLDGVKLTPEFLDNEEERLANLRRAAYEELVSERLKANESFRIFQSQMNHCLNEVRIRRRRLAKAGSSD